MRIEQITDYYTEIKKLILTQFVDKENYTKLIQIFLKQCDELETMYFQLLDERWLDQAIGEQLDLLGRILDIERSGREDESYRSLLNLKVSINVASGEPESVILAVKGVFDTVTSIQYIPEYPGKFSIWTDGNIGVFILENFVLENNDNFVLDNSDQFLLNKADPFATNLLTEISPAGVGLILLNNLTVFDDGYLSNLGYDDNSNHILVN